MYLTTRKVLVYRLWLFLIIYINIQCFPYVISKDLQIKISNDFQNLNEENEFTISISDDPVFRNSKLGYLSFDNEVIENTRVLPPLETICLRITGIPKEIYYIVVQVHTYLHDVTLGYQSNKADSHSYVTGTNIGLVNITNEKNFEGNVTLYLENSNVFNVTALIAVTAYDKLSPIPGGCNMEFQTEIAPYLILNFTSSYITILYEPASMPPSITNKKINCQIPPGSLLHYDVYHLYLPEQDFTEDTYFNSIKSMITVDRIRQFGKKVATSLIGPVNKRLFNSYIGTGSVFAVVVHTSSSINDDEELVLTTAAYIPTVTYACSPTHFVNGCQVFSSAFSESIFIIIFFTGVFLCLFGHVYFKTEMFMYGAFTSGVITYTLLVLLGNFTKTVIICASLSSTLIGGLVWLKVWSEFGIPVVSILLPLLNMGFLMTASLFYFFSDSEWIQPVLQSDANYWMSLFCGSLCITVLLMTKAQDASILTNSFIGGYIMIIPFDQFIGSNVKYIVVNIYRRVTIEEYTQAVIDPPFQIKDFILMMFWFIMFVSGYITQKTILSGKPPFPPPQHHQNEYNRIHEHRTFKIQLFIHRILVFLGIATSSRTPENNRSKTDDDDERTPILSGSSYSQPYTSPVSEYSVRSDNVFVSAPD